MSQTGSCVILKSIIENISISMITRQNLKKVAFLMVRRVQIKLQKCVNGKGSKKPTGSIFHE